MDHRMSRTLLDSAPAATRAWLEVFATRLAARRPELTGDSARRCALMAYPATCLLEPDEAVDLWLVSLGDRPVP
jgi:beta-phosphoglucomutase-like phosphatase (HAD superfamily)